MVAGLHRRTQEASRVVAGVYLDMHRFVTARIGEPGRPAPTAAAQQALDRLQQLGCLALALEERVDALDALARRIDETGDRALRQELERLAPAPCPVRFTTVTGVPAYVESLTVDRIVALAHEREREIRRAERTASLGEALREPAARLRAELTKLEALGTAAEDAGLGQGREPIPAEVQQVLDRLAKSEGGEPDGELPAAVMTAVTRVIGLRQTLRQGYYTELRALLALYRQMAADQR